MKPLQQYFHMALLIMQAAYTVDWMTGRSRWFGLQPHKRGLSCGCRSCESGTLEQEIKVTRCIS